MIVLSFLLSLAGASFGAIVPGAEEEAGCESTLETDALMSAPRTAQAGTRKREASAVVLVRQGSPGRQRPLTDPRPRAWQNGPPQPLRN